MKNLQTYIVPWGKYKLMSQGHNKLQIKIRSYKKGWVNPDPDGIYGLLGVIEMKGLNIYYCKYEFVDDRETSKYKNMDLSAC